jgi:hypothetical protein
MAISTVMVELKASISDMQMKFGQVKSELDGLSRKASSTGDKMAAVGKGLTLGLAGAAIAVGAGAVNLAEKFDAAHASMETAFKAAGVSAAQVKGPISAVDKAMEKLGYTNAETEGAVSKLAIAHVPLNQIMTDTTLAANIAAQRHIDLSSAMTIVTKAAEGNVGALKRMGIDLPVVAGGAAKVASAQAGLASAQDNVNKILAKAPDAAAKVASAQAGLATAHDNVNTILAKTPDAAKSASKAHAAYEAAVGKVATAQKKLDDATKSASNANPAYVAAVGKVTDAQKKLAAAQASGGTIIDQLSGRFTGQAAAAADTFNGKMKVLKATGEDYGVRLGNFLIPKLEDLAKKTEDVIAWFQKHKDMAEALGGAIGALGAIFVGAYGIQSVKKFAGAISDSIGTIKNLVGKLRGLGSAAGKAAGEQSTAAERAAGSMQAAADSMAQSAARIQESYGSIGTSAQEAAGAVGTAATEMDTEMAASATGIEGSAAAADAAFAGEGAAATAAFAPIAAMAAAVAAAVAAAAALGYLGAEHLPGNTSLLDQITGVQATINGTPVVTPAQLAQQQAVSNKQPVPMGPNGMPIPPSTSPGNVVPNAAARTLNAGAAGAVDWATVARAATVPGFATGPGFASHAAAAANAAQANLTPGFAALIAAQRVVPTQTPPKTTKARGNVSLLVR